MALLGKLFGADVQAFAKSLAEDLSKRYPPSLDQSAEKKISPNRLTKVLEDTFNKAVAFKTENKLGAYGKAKLGNSFRWELKDLGYTDEFIEVATEGMVVYLTRKAPPADPQGPK